MIRILSAAAAALALAGCSSLSNPFDRGGIENAGAETAPPPPAEQTAPMSDACPADAYQVLIGQPRAEIDVDSLPRPHRVYGHLDMVTMDYRPDRLNVVTGEDGVVRRVFCG